MDLASGNGAPKLLLTHTFVIGLPLRLGAVPPPHGLLATSAAQGSETEEPPDTQQLSSELCDMACNSPLGAARRTLPLWLNSSRTGLSKIGSSQTA